MNLFLNLSKIFLFVTFFGLQAWATDEYDQLPVKFPSTMSCIETVNIFGAEKLELLNWQLAGKGYSVVQQPVDSNKFIVDYSDGETIDIAEFSRNEIAKLTKKEIKAVKGVRSVGFWWADGDHIERQTLIECNL